MALDPLTNVNQSISEVEAAQDPLSAFNRLFSEVNTGIPTNPYPVISAPIPRTTSNAVDINQNLVGNEVTGPAPGVNNTTPQGNKSFTDAALDYMDDAENWAKDEYKYGRTYSYGAGWRNMQFERFYTHPNYKKLGFSPYRDNEELYNENSTWADDWRRSSSQYWKLLSNAFGSSIFGSDDFKAAETMQEGLALGSSSKEGIGSSITNFGLSSMYTLGIGAEMLAENAVLYAVEAGAIALAPETFGATLPLAAAAATKQAASAGKFIKAIENTYTFLKGLKQAQTVKEFYNASKIGQAGIAAAKFLNPLENTYQFTSFLAKGEKVWTSTEKLALAAHGFGHFFKDLRMISLGVEESGLEGAMARSEYHQKLIDEYYAKYGRMPEGQDAQEIYQKAASVDFTVSMANLPAIFLTNKIFFGKYLRGFPTLSSIAKTVEKDSTRYLVGVGAGKVLEKGAYEYAEKSAGRKAAEFFLSSPYLPWSREYFVTNLPEALQENLQDAISSSVIAYHEKIDKDPSVAGFWEGMSQFGTSVKGQLTGQGLETFLSGYFTGTLMGGISGPTIGIFETIASRTKSGKDKVEAAKERRKVREEAIKDAVNGMAMDAVNVGERNATTASKVKNYMDEADKAADEGNEYKYKSAVDAAFASKAYTLAATDKTKLFTDHIDEMLTLEDEDLAKAYNMPVAEAQDVRRRLNNAKQRALDVKDTYEIVKKEYPNPVDLSLIDRKKNEDLYKKMLAKYHAHEFAIETITTSTEALRRTNGRLIGIVNEFSQASPWLSLRRGAQEVKDAGASDITALLDNYQRQRLIETLELEVDTLKEGTPEQKKKAKLKQTKIDELKKWNDIAFKFTLIAKAREEAFRNKNVDLTGVNKLINNLTSEMYPIFDKYTKIIAEEQGGTLMSKELGKAFTKVRDYHLLDSDSNAYTKALNILNDPLYFDRYISAIETAQEQLQATKAERIVEGYKKFLDLKDSNDLLNAIYDQGLFVIPENVEEFLKNPRTAKFELYDIASKEPIAPGNPKYEAFQNILNDRYPVEEVVTEEVETEVVEEEAPAQKAISVVDDINTMPKELQEELIKKYESLKTYFAEERPDVKFPYYNFDQFLKRSPEAKQIIEAYNKKNNLKPAPAETKAGVFTPTTPYGTPKGPELTTATKPEAPVSDKKADIERRRQETINSIKEGYNGGKTWEYAGQFKSQATKIVNYEVFQNEYTKEQIESEINAKYDAELKALEGVKPKAPVSDIEAKKADIERRRQEELNKINPVIYKKEKIKKDFENEIGEEVGLVGSVFKGTAKEDSDIDIVFRNIPNTGEKITPAQARENSKVIYDKLKSLADKGIITDLELKANGNLGVTFKYKGQEFQVAPNNKENFEKTDIRKSLDAINAKYDAELDALEGAKPAAKPVEEVKVVEFKVGDRVKINTEKDGEGIIKEDRGDKVLLQDGRQVAKKNLLPIEEKPVVEPNLIPEVTTATYEQVIKLLENLNEKDLIVSDDETIYINRDNPNDVFDRISSLTKKKEFKDKRDAKRGTIIDDLFRRFINPEGDIKTEGDLILAYSKHPKKSQAQKFENSFLKGLYKIFNDIKTIAEKENLSLIANTKPLWGVLNGTKYAGAMDILAVNKNTGKVYIVDLKTSSLNRREEYIKEEAFRELAGDLYQDMKIKISEADNNILAVKNFTKEEIAVADKFLEDYPGFETKKGAQVSPIYFYSDSDTTQQSGYAELLRQRTGINVANILTFPIQTTKSADKSTYLLAKPLVDKNSKFTLQVNVDKELAPEQKLPAGSVEHIEPLIVEEAPETYISIRQDRYNELVVELDELGNQLIKFGKDPSIYEGVKSIKEEAEIMAINGNLTSKQANNLTKIINNILLNYKNIDLIEKGDIIIFTANPDIEYEVVDRTKKELKYYAKSLSFEERNITAPESISATEIFKIKSVIKPGEIVKQEPLTPEEKEINSNNVKTVDDVLKDEQIIKNGFETKKSDNQIDDEWFDDLTKCNTPK